ncbi:FtsH protease activity modulator HflK [Lachnospiraceae bacterium MD1]|uniref:Protein HflK n=1 Tax=Variimorphobacter saccharofermentans TaxID=2755051 RepID=A0A839K243_9FIRM|nr:FtsH protease activity modulator HflK [Variimorphobacter saccharofermentans]MBB2183069.1 FtsH protease activity modulator HflK [Variimorphobacter saccharofermentans]
MSEQQVYDYPPNKNVGSFMKKFGKIFFLVIGLIVIAILIFGSFYTIKEQEQAVVTTFGRAKTVNSAGLHFKIPIIQRVQKVDTTIKGFSIGYDLETGNKVEEESMMITRDFNFVNVDFFVEYKVSDPVKALYASEEPITILKNIAQSSIRMVVGSYDVDSVITTGKYEIQSAIKTSILEELEQHDIGIQLVNITIQDSEPPTDEVMEAFKSVETAKQGKETAVNNANKYRNEQLPKADAQVDKILQEAQSTKTKRMNEAYAEVARFNEMYEEYAKYPLITKQRMFYEAMEDVLPSLKVIIDSSDSEVQKLLPLDSLIGLENETDKVPTRQTNNDTSEEGGQQ